MAKILSNICFQVLGSNVNVCNADTELQQRAVEYLQLSSIASQDVLATGRPHFMLILLFTTFLLSFSTLQLLKIDLTFICILSSI